MCGVLLDVFYPNPPGPGGEGQVPRGLTTTATTFYLGKINQHSTRWIRTRDKMMVNTGMIRMVKMSTILIVFYPNPPGPGARDERPTPRGTTHWMTSKGEERARG